MNTFMFKKTPATEQRRDKSNVRINEMEAAALDLDSERFDPSKAHVKALDSMDNSMNTSVTEEEAYFEDSSIRSTASIETSLDESLAKSLSSIYYYKENKRDIQEKAKQETKDDVGEIDAIVELVLSLENIVDNDGNRQQNKKEEQAIDEKRIQKNKLLEKTIDKAIYVVGCYWIVP